MGSDCHLRDSRHHCPTEEKDRIGSYSNGKKLSFEEWTCKTWAPDSFEFRSNEPVSRFEKFNSESPSSTLPFYSIENLIFGYVARNHPQFELRHFSSLPHRVTICAVCLFSFTYLLSVF